MKRLLLVLSMSMVFGCEEKMSQAEMDRFLIIATERPGPGDYERVRELVEKGANLEYRDEGRTALLNAAYGYSGSGGRRLNDSLLMISDREGAKIVKYLVSNGAELKQTDRSQNKRTALHLAAITGRPQTIKTLVELGIQIDARDAMNATPLIHAAASGCIEAVKACVEAGADINAVMNGNRTALDGAHEYNTREAYGMNMVVCKDHDEIIAYLESNGAKRGDSLSKQ